MKPQTDKNFYLLSYRLRVWQYVSALLRDSPLLCFKKFIKAGSYGKVYLAEIAKQNIIVKRQELEDETGITQPFQKKFLQIGESSHTAYIDLAASQLVNELVLQKICPNFVLNYRYAGKVTNESSTLELYNEFIEDFKSFHDWQKGAHTSEEWASLFFQLLFALHCMDYHFNMKHNDLHGDNIFVKNTAKGGYFCYILHDRKYYIPNLGFLLLVNDYGMVRIPKKLEIGWYHKNYSRAKESDVKFVRNNVRNAPKLFQKYFLGPLKEFDSKKKITISDIIFHFFGSSDYSQTYEHQGLDIDFTKKKPKSSLILSTFDGDKSVDRSWINKNLEKYIR